MSFWTLNADCIVKIFNANELDMPLSKAFEVAHIIENLHLESINEIEAAAFNRGKEGKNKENYDRGYSEGYDSGMQIGRSEIQGDELRLAKLELTRLQEAILRKAQTEVSLIVTQDNKGQKIKRIKELRDRIAGLGLKDAKDIVDAYIAMLDEAARMQGDYSSSSDGR